MVLIHPRAGLTLYVNLKWASQELEGFQRICLPFKGEHLERDKRGQLWTSWPAYISPRASP